MGFAEEALIPRERVGWGVWGSSNSKQLPGGFARGCLPALFLHRTCTSQGLQQHLHLHRRLRPGKNRHLPYGQEDITFTLLKHHKDWEKQCRSAVLKYLLIYLK